MRMAVIIGEILKEQKQKFELTNWRALLRSVELHNMHAVTLVSVAKPEILSTQYPSEAIRRTDNDEDILQICFESRMANLRPIVNGHLFRRCGPYISAEEPAFWFAFWFDLSHDLSLTADILLQKGVCCSLHCLGRGSFAQQLKRTQHLSPTVLDRRWTKAGEPFCPS